MARRHSSTTNTNEVDSFRRLLRTPLVGLMFVTAFVSVVAPAAAQNRPILQAILETLLEDERDEDQHVHQHPDLRFPGRGQVIINQGPLNSGRTVLPGSATVTPAMIQVRQQLTQLSTNCEQLVTELNIEQQYIPQVRPMLADCLQLKATCDVMLRRANTINDVQLIADDCRRLDRKWRVLSHRLKKIRNLGRKSRRHIDVIDQADAQICTSARIQPQFDRQQVIRMTGSLANHYRDLVQLVNHEVRTLPQGPAILRDCQDLYTEVYEARSLARTGTYDQLVSAYNGCNRRWRKLARRLANCKSPRIRQHVHKIQHVGRQCQEQLWIPIEVDMEFVNYLIQSIDADTRGAFANITVDEFLGASPLCQAVTACFDFRNAVQSMVTCFASNPSLDELTWDFRSLDVQWTEIQQLCRQFSSPVLHAHLDNLEVSMASARQYLGEIPVFTQPQLIEVVDGIDQHCHDINHYVQQIAVPQLFQPVFTQELRGSCQELQVAVRELHQTAVTRCRRSHMPARDKARRVLAVWKGLRQNLRRILQNKKCTPYQRQQCIALRNQIDPLMVKLQLVYEG